jgi:hypothetical protein
LFEERERVLLQTSEHILNLFCIKIAKRAAENLAGERVRLRDAVEINGSVDAVENPVGDADARVHRARAVVPVIGGNNRAGKALQSGALFACHHKSPRRAASFMCATDIFAIAIAVNVGFKPAPVTKTLVSQTNRFFTSCVWQNSFTTDSCGLAPMRHVPIACAP